jgi:hypothetical protein
MQLVISNSPRMATFVLLILDALLVQIFSLLQISYPLGFFANSASEIQYYFNDLSTNDFNILFQQIPPLNLRCGGNDNSFDVNYLPFNLGFGRSTKKTKKHINT